MIMTRNRRVEEGCSLIELLVVIAILGILDGLLNLAHGSNPGPACAVIAAANGLLLNCALPRKVATKSALGQAMTAEANMLELYNSGVLTIGCAP